MKLTFTGKLILDELITENDSTVMKFKSYLKEDFVERALIITIISSNVEKVYFSSREYGNATWYNGHGVNEANRWENEDDLMSLSILARRYPTILQDGAVAIDYAKKYIIPDVIDNMLDKDLAFKILQITKNMTSKELYDWDKIIEFNKILSNDFVDNLIIKYELMLRNNYAEDIQNNYKSINNKHEKDGRINSHGISKNIIDKIKNIFKREENYELKNVNKENGKEPDYSREDVKEYLEKAKLISKKINKL
jgi:hypothetical protein